MKVYSNRLLVLIDNMLSLRFSHMMGLARGCDIHDET